MQPTNLCLGMTATWLIALFVSNFAAEGSSLSTWPNFPNFPHAKLHFGDNIDSGVNLR